MNIIAWIILGLLAGALAKAIYPGHQGGGLIVTMLLGLAGAFIGGSLYVLFTTGGVQLTVASFTLPGLVVALLGSLLVLFIWGMVARRTV
jgi:uncharacterized membrane protein YeaQ/YmgE (transglycosylase-associated protein family)